MSSDHVIFEDFEDLMIAVDDMEDIGEDCSYEKWVLDEKNVMQMNRKHQNKPF